MDQPKPAEDMTFREYLAFLRGQEPAEVDMPVQQRPTAAVPRSALYAPWTYLNRHPAELSIYRRKVKEMMEEAPSTTTIYRTVARET